MQTLEEGLELFENEIEGFQVPKAKLPLDRTDFPTYAKGHKPKDRAELSEAQDEVPHAQA